MADDFVGRFIKEHKEYFSRNEKIIESNTWNEVENYNNTLSSFAEQVLQISNSNKKDKEKQIRELQKEIKLYTDSAKKTKEALFKQENELTTSILGRLSAFIKEVESNGDRKNERVQPFIDFTVKIINLHINKCNKYLSYNLDAINQTVDNEQEAEYRSSEIVFQDEVFTSKIKIQDDLHKLNISGDIDNVKITFFKDQKATIPMIDVLKTYSSEIRDLTKKLNLPKKVGDIEFYIHKEKREEETGIQEIPQWEEKKHFWEQKSEVLNFWYNEWLKITVGFTVDGYFFHPWLYYHLNFYKTLIPQKDGTEPVVNPTFRDNEQYLAELLKKCDEVKNRGILLYGTRRYGKALRDDQVLHYIDGTQRPIGESKVGDKIFGSDGKETTILGVYPQGVLKTYRVELADGRVSYCCEDHLWTVFDYQAQVYKTLPLKELLRDGYSYKRNRTWKGKNEISTLYKYYLPITKAVEYNSDIDLSIDPYYLGLWLGDGTSRNTSITTIDEEIKTWLKEFTISEGLLYSEETKKGTEAVTVKLVTNNGKENLLLNKLRQYSLIQNKHIPKEYLTSSVEVRMELLRGLMDTDGTISKSGGDISIGLANKKLALDILALCRSLGIACNYLYKKGKYIKKSRELNDVYKVTMFTNKDVFKLPRKLERIDSNPIPARLSKMERVAIIGIYEDLDASATCIRVSNKSKEFLTNDFIVTHNSVTMSSVCEWKALIKDNASTAITSGSAGDLAELTHKMRTSMKFKVPAFQLPVQKQEWDGGIVELGLKWDSSTLIEHSRHTIKNLSGGATTSTQKTAGGAPSIFLIEEIGKTSWEKAYLAAIPSFETPDGFKTTIIAVGTSGEASLSKDAMKAVSNPSSFKFLEMDWDLLEKHIPVEAITWKRRTFANFVPAQMAYKTGFKRIERRFGDFLGIESEYLNKITIHQTDWINNTRVLLEARKEVEKDALKLQQETIQYPIDPEECFLSAEKNPFPYMEAIKRKQYLLESGKWDRRRVLYKDDKGKLKAQISTMPLIEYPHKGGIADAPLLIFEDIPETPPVDNLYICSFDDVKQDDSDTDSLISFQIWKMKTFGDEWGGRLVLSWTLRPENRRPMYEKWLALQQAYNARAFPENEDMGYKSFLETKHLDERWLISAVDFTSAMNINSNQKRKYGWTPRQSKRVLLGLMKDKMEDPVFVGSTDDEDIEVMGVQQVDDIGLLEEIINYKEDVNVDRISAALGAVGWMHYLEINWILPKQVREQTEEEKNRVFRKSPIRAGRSSRTRL